MPTKCCRTTTLVPDEDVELTDRERTMARQLVESLAVDEFEPDKFHDEYREQVLDLIARKAAGEEFVAEPVVEAPAKVLDLVAALEASLAKADDREGPASERCRRAARPTAAKRRRKKAAKPPAKKRTTKAAAKPAAKKRSA